MQKILYTVTVLDPGAVPNILLDILPFLQAKGWDAECVALQVAPNDASAQERAQRLGMEVHHLGASSWNIPQAVARLRGYLKGHPVSLIHSHLGRADLVTSWAKPPTLPQVSTFHSVKRNFHPLTLLGYHLTDSRVAHRTGVSQAVIDSFYGRGGLRSEHSVVYNPVSLERLRSSLSREMARKRLGIEGGPVLVQVGRMIPVKAHCVTLRAFSIFQRRLPDAALVFVGSGPLEGALRQQSEKLGIADRIRWTGFVPPADVYPAADVVVFPSLWEGLGLVPIEAMLLGIPVVSSNLPAVREFITHGVEGFLVPPGDPDALEDGVWKALHDPPTTDAARRRAEAMFDPARVAEAYHRLYSHLGGWD